MRSPARQDPSRFSVGDFNSALLPVDKLTNTNNQNFLGWSLKHFIPKLHLIVLCYLTDSNVTLYILFIINVFCLDYCKL